MKKIVLIIVTIAFLSSTSFSQRRKVYKAGESTPTVTVRKDSTDQRPQKVNATSTKEKACNCKNDLEFDPTTKQALDKNKTGKPLFTGTCVTFYPNRKLEMKVTYVEGREDGVLYKFYEDGTHWEKDSTLMWVQNFRFDKKHGKQTYYYPNGNMKKTEVFEMDVKNGTFEQYYEDGGLKKIVTYKTNKFDGPYMKYADDSTLLIEKEYKEGVIEGKDNSYFEDGTLAYQTSYLKGEKDGEWIYNFEDGSPERIENYKKGMKDGEWTEYYKNGKIKEELVYKKDKLISKKQYNKFGDLMETSK